MISTLTQIPGLKKEVGTSVDVSDTPSSYLYQLSGLQPLQRKCQTRTSYTNKKVSTDGRTSDIVSSLTPYYKQQVACHMRQNCQNWITEVELAGDHWNEEDLDTKGPSAEVVEQSRNLVDLSASLEAYPKRITQSSEEGMFFTYRTPDSRVFMEIFNEGGLAYHHHNITEKKTRMGELNSIYDFGKLLSSLGYTSA